MKSLNEIKKIPTVVDNVHESVYRSYWILEYVHIMLKRGDSIESITEVIELMEQPNCVL